MKAGKLNAAGALIKDLKDYPLYVYLRAAELEPHLQKSPNPALETFLTDYAGSYPAEKLRTAWLEWLASADHWQTFLTYYRAQSDTALQCSHKKALLETAQKSDLFRQILPLWTVGKSQPSACDRVFRYFESHDAFGDPVIWQRFRAAIDNRQTGLARYLARKFAAEDAKTWADRWLKADSDPTVVLKQDYLLSGELLARDVLFHALARLARSNFSAAEKNWVRLSTSAKLSAEDVNRGHLILANAAGRAEHKNQIFYLDQVENRFADASLESLRLRRGIQLRAWPELNRWTSDPPVSPQTNALRWRYWHARSAELIGKHEQAQKAYQLLAGERDYYGFVAADKINRAYEYNDRPIKPTATELSNLASSAEIARAKEFYELGMLIEANRQWYWAIRSFSKQELEFAAYAASSWGWHNRAIATLGKARSYDDVQLRFPVLFREEITANARKRGVETALVYAIVRTESAFHPSAHSPTGALGLMQLMPATGREVGRRIGVRINKTSQLLAPATNIAIGSSYLSSLMKKYAGNFPMAAAAYNAGPHRVRQWRPQTECVASDIWIDSIPFRETRRYVRTTLFYYVIYQYRLGMEVKPLRAMLTGVTPKNASSCNS